MGETPKTARAALEDLSVEKNKELYHHSQPLALEMGSIGKSKIQNSINLAGFSGWIPNYGSLHIYSNNMNLTIHLNFPQEVAQSYLTQIKDIIKEKVSLSPSTKNMKAVAV